MTNVNYNFELYKASLESALVRLKNLCCLDDSALQFGSCDRDFWAYRTIRGFNSSPFQHVMSGLALLSDEFNGAERDQMHQSALSILKFWIKSRNKNGSADEWYKYEQSFCATAIGLHSALETLTLLKDDLDSEFVDEALGCLKSSETWLVKRSNPLAANQEIASSTSRLVLGQLTNDNFVVSRARDALERIYKSHSEKGYLNEYGGCDLGYSLLSLDFLVIAHQHGDSLAGDLASDICQQIGQFVSKSGDLPFAIGSRGTSHHFYGGLHYFSRFYKSAGALQDQLRHDHLSVQTNQLEKYDDRYFCTFAFPAFIRMIIFSQRPSVESIKLSPRSTIGLEKKLKSTIHRVDSNNFTVFCNVGFGSALQIISQDHQSFIHLGYSLSGKGIKQSCSLTLSKKNQDLGVHKFSPKSTFYPLLKYELVFKLLSISCRISFIASAVSWWAKHRIGRPHGQPTATLNREVICKDDTCQIVDQIVDRESRNQRYLSKLTTFPFHSPSAMNGTSVQHLNIFSAHGQNQIPFEKSKIIKHLISYKDSFLRVSTEVS